MENVFSEFPKEKVLKFKTFIIENKKIFYEFAEAAKEIKNRGVEKFSAQHIVYYLRNKKGLESTDSKFKISNDFTKMLAILAEENFPELKNFFRRRESAK